MTSKYKEKTPAEARPTTEPPWLLAAEDVRSIAWASEETFRTKKRFASSPEYHQAKAELNEALSVEQGRSKSFRVGQQLYRLVAENGPGRSRIEVHSDGRRWTPVVDLTTWSMTGASSWIIRTVLPAPTGGSRKRVLVKVSPYGKDQSTTLEVDLSTGQPVSSADGGFFVEKTKGGLQWITENEVLAFVSLSESEQTHAGHPRIVRWWSRGTNLSDARVVAEARRDDLTVTAHVAASGLVLARYHRRPGPDVYELVSPVERSIVPVPLDVVVRLGDDGIFFAMAETTEFVGQPVRAGTLLHMPISVLTSGAAVLGEPKIVFHGSEDQRIQSFLATGKSVHATVLDDGLERVIHAWRGQRQWNVHEPEPTLLGSARLSPVANSSGQVHVVWSSLTQTPIHELRSATGQLVAPASGQDTNGGVLQRRHVRSSDGTEVTYFLASRARITDAPVPTLLIAYGGFGACMVPKYSPELDHGWLARGGAVAIAQVRGGGERGPKWHRAGQGKGKRAAVEDLRAVAADLYATGFTDPNHLGCQGVSNGGLLAMLFAETYPEMLGAAVVHNAVLDLTRYDSFLGGRAWNDEYEGGDADHPSELHQMSPLHLLARQRSLLPPVLLTAEQNDDRVDPTHSRTMAHRLQSLGSPVWYLEGQGNHRGATTLQQDVERLAIVFDFLWDTIGD